MALLNSTVGLVYSISADDSDARKSVSDLRKHIDDETSKIEEDGSNAFLSLGQSIGLTDDQLAGLGKTLPIVGAVAGAFATGVVAVTTAAVTATAALFKLSNEAADFGSEIFDASEKTGLSAETLSSLKLAADQSGTSLEQVTASIAKFSKLVGEAVQGSEEAKNKLTALGVDPQEAINDLDGALEKVFKRIVELPPGIQQAKAAQDAFGKSGTDLLPFIKSFDGDMQGLIKTAKELGVTIDDDAAAAADEFGDTLDQTKAQVQGIANTIGLEFMPLFLDATKSVSRWLKENRGDIKTWATNSADLIRGLIAYWTDLKNAVENYTDAFNQSRLSQGTGITAQRIFDPLDVIGTGTKILQGTVKRGRAERKGQAESELGGDLGTARDGYLQDLEGQKQAAEKLAQENQAAQERINKAIADGNRAAFEKEQAQLIEQYKQRGITADIFNNEFLENERQFRVKMLELLDTEYAQKRANEKNAKAKEALKLEEQNARDKIIDESTKREQEAEKLITETVKQETEKQTKAVEESVKTRIELYKKNTEAGISSSQRLFEQRLRTEKEHIEAVQKFKINAILFEEKELRKLEQTKEVTRRLDEITAEKVLLMNANEKQWREYYEKSLEKEIDKRERLLLIEEKLREKREQQLEYEREIRSLGQDITPPPGYDSAGNPTTTTEPINPLDGNNPLLGESILTTIDAAGGRVLEFGNAWKELKNIAADALSSMAQGIGNMVQNLVLLGNTGGNSFRKLVASVLAGVASQAAVLAVMETAYGIAALTPWGAAVYGNPAFHFKAAALFGSIAVATGLLGRAVAGDAFKQQASGSAISGSSGNNSQGNSNGGRAYSSSGDQVTTITNDRNQPQERRIKISLERGLIAEVIKEDINSNGSIRRTLIDVVQGA